MLKVKNTLFVLASLIGSTLFASADKTTVLVRFMNKLKTLEAISERIDSLAQFGEPNGQISDMFAQNVQPLLEQAQEINDTLTLNGHRIDDAMLNTFEIFETTYKYYEELIVLINAFLTQVEKIYALCG